MSTIQFDCKNLLANMQFFLQPEVSWNKWFKQACLVENDLTELGTFLQGKLQGGTFVDIPCGNAKPQGADGCKVLDVISQLGIAHYVEVDNNKEVLGERLNNNPRLEEGIHITTTCADILAYLLVQDINKGKACRAIYISGLQPEAEFCANAHNQQEVIVPYIQALYRELGMISKQGDVLILNDADSLVLGIDQEKFSTIHPSMGLLKHGFELRRTCPYGKVSVYEKMK